MFKSAVFKLTISYLAIVMSLSLFFSSLLYWRLNTDLDQGLSRQAVVFQQRPFDSFVIPLNQFDQVRQQQLNEARERMVNILWLANSFIFLVAGLGSFLLARRTLLPIEVAHDAQGRFTADASHELRTPLTAMKTEIEVAIRDKSLSIAEARKLLHSNLEEVDKLQSLSEGLLRLANYHKSPNSFKMITVGDIIEQSISKMSKALEQKNIEIKVGKSNIIVEGDEFALIEAVTILLDNAIKYSPKNGAITIETVKSSAKVLISIADLGPGIKHTDLPHIFDRFYRGDTSRTKNSVSGYGLGLSIAQKIVQIHHGTITVDSRLDHGSKFTIHLPTHQSTLTIKRS